MKDLRYALDGTLIFMKQLTTSTKRGKGLIRLMVPVSEKKSLVSIQAFLQHSPTPPRVASAVGSLQGLQSNIKAYREKMDSAFLRIMGLNNVVNDQTPHGNPAFVSMPTVRNRLVGLLTSRKLNTIGIDERIIGKLLPTSLQDVGKAPGRPPPPNVSARSALLRLPTELLIIIISDLNEDLPHGADTLPALRL
jgi:hypothetical protein